jgi:dephospho-CoA kinase
VHLLGITGGVGMGKSTAGELLLEVGVRVVDTDLLAREESKPGSFGFARIVEAFGPDVVDASGTLNRSQLAKLVFGNPEARQRLEGILHPLIFSRWRAVVANWRATDVQVGAVVIPLLFEKEYAAHFDAVVCVACTQATQGRRLIGRGWTPSDAEARVAAQMPVTDKMARANYVIWTEGSLDSHRRQWTKVLADVTKAS